MPLERRRSRLPNPPLRTVEGVIRNLWASGLNDNEILQRLLARHVSQGHSLGIKKLRKMREELGLFTVRKQSKVEPERDFWLIRRQAHTVDSITPAMTLLRQDYPHVGRRAMLRLLVTEHGIKTTRAVYDQWVQLYEPDLARKRRSRRLKRKRFVAAGCHDLWCCDQHDKWKRFGLGLHVCLDPFSGKIIWLKVWWGNRNPRLIFAYYLEAVRRLGYTCLVGQGDTGSENWCFAKGHTYIRHALDPGLGGTIQFRFMRHKKNIAPEIFWSGFRRGFAPGFEDILEAPLRYPNNIRFDPADPLQYNVFKWIFIPWLQRELDCYVERLNTTKKRYQRSKILPQGGCPNDIEEYPEEYGVTNFKIIVDPNARCLQEAEQLYAPPGHATFELVPPVFDVQANAWYVSQGRPEINRRNVWNIYMNLLTYFEASPELFAAIKLSAQPEEEKEGAGNNFIPDDDDVLVNLNVELREMPQLMDNPYGYEGGVGLGTGDVSDSDFDEEACEPFEATFTDEEGGMDPLVETPPVDGSSSRFDPLVDDP